MATLEKLIAQRDELDRQITELQQRERERLIVEIRGTMNAYGLTPLDLAGRKRKPRSDIGKPRTKKKGRAR